jgi:hypothetical protein
MKTPEGFYEVWEHEDWVAYGKSDVTLYRYKKDGRWAVSVDQVWVGGVYDTPDEALEAAV